MANPRIMNWDPTQFFRTEEGLPPSPYALLILNHPINERAYDVLRKHGITTISFTPYIIFHTEECILNKRIALTTVCADGGANHFYEMMKARGREDVDVCIHAPYPYPCSLSMLYICSILYPSICMQISFWIGSIVPHYIHHHNNPYTMK